MYLIDWMMNLNRPWAMALYIYRVWRSRPSRKSFQKPNLSELLDIIRTWGHRSDRSNRRAELPRRHISLILKSKSGILYMNVDLLDESYPMVKSKMHFMEFSHSGLTGRTHRSNRSGQTCQFWVRTCCIRLVGILSKPITHVAGINLQAWIKTSGNG
jgi:hypothetical protein